MEQYRQKLRIRVIWLSIVLLLATFIYVVLTVKKGLPEMPDFIRGFQTGIFLAFVLLLLGSLFRSIKAMTSDTALKRRYIYENDERTILIAQKTGALGMNICLAGLSFAAAIAGFLNATVFYSLFGAAAFAALVKGFFKLYYHFKL